MRFVFRPVFVRRLIGVPLLAAVASVGWATGSSGSAAAQGDSAVSSLEAVSLVAAGDQFNDLLATVDKQPLWEEATQLSSATSRALVDLPIAAGPAAAKVVQAVGDLKTIGRDYNAARFAVLGVTGRLLSAERTRQIRADQLAAAKVRLQKARDQMTIVAVALYTEADDAADDLLSFDVETMASAQTRLELTEVTLEEMLDRKAVAIEDVAQREIRQAEAEAAVVEKTATVVEAQALTVALRERQALTSLSIDSLLPDLANYWISAPLVGGQGLSPRALDAYVSAEIATQFINPSCGISWAMIAAIGAVESRHGTYGDTLLGVDGLPQQRIVGIALDGVNVDNAGVRVAAMSDTDNGEFDGDPYLDRAVGPMQFIPQTWASWGRDADDDGVRDPHDIDDAALAAAAYLCHYGPLTNWDNWKSAVFGYNHSNAYVISVKSSLDRMAGIKIDPTPEGFRLRPRVPAGVYFPPVPEPCPEPLVHPEGNPFGDCVEPPVELDENGNPIVPVDPTEEPTVNPESPPASQPPTTQPPTTQAPTTQPPTTQPPATTAPPATTPPPNEPPLTEP